MEAGEGQVSGLPDNADKSNFYRAVKEYVPQQNVKSIAGLVLRYKFYHLNMSCNVGQFSNLKPETAYT